MDGVLPVRAGREGVERGRWSSVTRRRLRVDWPACKAHGICHQIAPELVDLDEWGYPIIAPADVPAHLRSFAQRAVASCPTLALRLVQSR